MRPRIKVQKVYRSTGQAIRDGWPDAIGGTNLEIADYNLLAHFARQLLKADPNRDRAEVRDVAINAFKKNCAVRGGKWVVLVTYKLAHGIEFPNPLAAQPVESFQGA